MLFRDRILFVIGLLVATCSFLITTLFIIGMTVSDYSLPEESLLTDVLIVILLGFVPLVIGIIVWRIPIKRERERQKDRLENDILQLVASLKGKITIAELAQHTRLSIQQAEEKLETYVKIGVAERLISEGGVFVYYFPSVISKEEKHQTKSLHEL